MMTRGYASLGGLRPYGGLLMLLTWVVTVVAVVWLLQALAAPQPARMYNAAPGRNSEYEAALALLTRRYNAGEIDAIAYEQARGALGRP